MSKELEALKIIKVHLRDVKMLNQAYKLVEQGLDRLEDLEKKEIPVKPTRFYYGEYARMFECPKCSEDDIIDGSNYCQHCGQKLNWGKEEELKGDD